MYEDLIIDRIKKQKELEEHLFRNALPLSLPEMPHEWEIMDTPAIEYEGVPRGVVIIEREDR